MENSNLVQQFELENQSNNNGDGNWPKIAKILLGVASGIIIVLLGVIIYLAVENGNLKDKDNDPIDTSYNLDTSTDSIIDTSSDYDPIDSNTDIEDSSDEASDSTEPEPVEFDTFAYFGKKYTNLSYDVDGMITNSFKEEGDNYHPEIGVINNDLDYTKNDRSFYDLYIPKYAERRKNEINGIILWIHGGAWIKGNKEGMDFLCKFYSQIGYISATVGYTLLDPKLYTEFNIYRIFDEITACIKALKRELISRGFNGDKLRLGIAGYSAGAHLTLLYSYLIENNDIPLKFIINMVGPIGFNPKYFYKLADDVEPFDDITDINNIEDAMREGKIIKINPDSVILTFMNLFLGNRYSQDEIKSILDKNGEINYENELYKNMSEAVKYSDATKVEDKHPDLPTLCVYGGRDDIVGVTAYAYLKNTTKRNFDYIYSKNEGHMLIIPQTAEGVEIISDISASIMEYCEKYFYL